MDRAGALPPDSTAGHRWHRQEYASLVPGSAPDPPVRGGALALGTRRPLVRGPGCRLHHVLLRDAARRLPRLAGAADQPVAGTFAGPSLPARTRQSGDAPGER